MTDAQDPPRRVLVLWSTGKDSAWMLHVLRQRPEVTVVGLLTTICMAEGESDGRRVTVHGTPEALLDAQAAALECPVRKVHLPDPCPNEIYEQRLQAALQAARVADDVAAVAFGDLFLDDIRAYREQLLAPTGLTPLFPLWGHDTQTLARTMVDAGLRAVLTCVDTTQLDASFVGRPYDRALLDALPASADPCGENGEFHTFAYAGPMFKGPVNVRVAPEPPGDRFARASIAAA